MGFQARELRPDRRDQQEGDHTCQKIDVRNQIQVGIDGLFSAFTTVVD
jgi:hypothetical protein